MKSDVTPLKTEIETASLTTSSKKPDNRVFFGSLGITKKQFRMLFNNMPHGLALHKILYDEKGTPVDFVTLEGNKAYKRMLGVKKADVVFKNMAKSYPLTILGPASWLEIYGKVASTGKPKLFEAYSETKGNYYQVYVYSMKKDYFVSVFLDVTAQRKKSQQELAELAKAEQQLVENAKKYEYLSKHAPMGIFEIDYNGPKFKSVNNAICKMLGYSEQELLAMNPFDLLYDGSKKRFQERINSLLNGKKVDKPIEYYAKTKDGRGIWGIMNIKLNYKNGKIDSALVIAHDITARKKTEEELLSAEKKYRRLYETTQDGIMARDVEGKMIDCNKAYARMLGYSKKELKNLSVQGLLPEKWHEQREKIVNKILQTGRSIVFEREYRRKDGSIFPASVRSWRLTDGKGKVIGTWSIVRDITEQKERQKNLEKNTDMLQKIIEERTKQLKNSERLAAIGQTAGMVGHDLRNPLQTITGELYLAKSEVDSLEAGTTKMNLQESLRVIEEQATYMDKIVSDLQAFVQPIKIDKTPFSLKELASAVIESIAIPANITVKIQIPKDFPQIKADFQLLKRVLINLVTNAVQAMPEGGKLALTSKVDSEGHVFISVQDTGIGIPEEIKPQIFTPLFTTKPRGQGFGLAVCKRVIEAHGGAISFESKKGKGTKFTIRFTAS
ncbi:MAG: PAS domain S-box protein [Candidatus Bathyarchaeota archaeon]|nr:PAS domain S-box protein [Candidatus Bathyarchaeota archaeon]